MSSPWASPDPQPHAGGTALSRPTVSDGPAPPPWWRDLWAGLLTVAVSVLVAAPLGLLWAAVAPHVVVVIEGGEVDVVGTYTDGFIAVDGYFLAAVTVAGAVGAAMAWWLASEHGPAVVLALTVGGLAAAWTAMRVGGLVGDTPVADLVQAGVEGRRELAVQVRATTALLGWPLASLVTYLVLALRERGRERRRPQPASGAETGTGGSSWG